MDTDRLFELETLPHSVAVFGLGPVGVELAHLFAWAIGFGMRATDILSMPFYHPVLEEGLRSAFRKAARKSSMPKPQFEMLGCQASVTG